MLRYCTCASQCNLFNTFVYQHTCLPLVLRGKYYPYDVEGFENKHKSKRKRIIKKRLAETSLVALTDLGRLTFIHKVFKLSVAS